MGKPEVGEAKGRGMVSRLVGFISERAGNFLRLIRAWLRIGPRLLATHWQRQVSRLLGFSNDVNRQLGLPAQREIRGCLSCARVFYPGESFFSCCDCAEKHDVCDRCTITPVEAAQGQAESQAQLGRGSITTRNKSPTDKRPHRMQAPLSRPLGAARQYPLLGSRGHLEPDWLLWFSRTSSIC